MRARCVCQQIKWMRTTETGFQNIVIFSIGVWYVNCFVFVFRFLVQHAPHMLAARRNSDRQAMIARRCGRHMRFTKCNQKERKKSSSVVNATRTTMPSHRSLTRSRRHFCLFLGTVKSDASREICIHATTTEGKKEEEKNVFWTQCRRSNSILLIFHFLCAAGSSRRLI